MKLTQNPCRIKLPNTKSAKALSELILPVPVSFPSMVDFDFFAPVDDGALVGGRSEVCMRNDAVRTNWPTAALKPERKALNGYICLSQVSHVEPTIEHVAERT